MAKVKPSIIYPMDPLGYKIGGIQTYLKNFIKYSPADFEIGFVGVTSDRKKRPVGEWHRIIVCGKKINFLPVLYVKDENVRTKVPLSLKFTLSLFRYKKRINCENRILTYHRLEPELVFVNTPVPKIAFVHYNVKDSLYGDQTEVKWRRFPWLYFYMEKKLLSRMNKIIAVNRDTIEFYNKKYSCVSEKISFVPTWVDRQTFFPYAAPLKSKHKLAFLKEHKLPTDAKLILFVGRFEGQKDPLLLIDSFHHVNTSAPETRLLIVGKGALKNKMQDRIAQHGLRDKVILFNSLQQEKVAALMKISDVFMLSSASEGMPISVLEALGCGLPVVSTDVGEVKRVVKDEISGMICSERDPAVIGNAALHVLKEDKFSAENCILSIQDYTAERILKRIYDTYRQLESNWELSD
jgi:glycosyltransferase involved in cell wall biosynthesis